MKDKIRIRLRESIQMESDSFDNFIENQNMSAKEFATSIVRVFNNSYGSHNANDFLEIINSGIQR